MKWPNERKRAVVRERVVDNVLTGVAAASFFSAWAALAVWLRGPQLNSQIGVSLWGIVLAYFIGGALGGVVVGLLWRGGRSVGVAALVGYLAAIPFVVSVSLFMVDQLWHVVPLTIVCSLVGAAVGAGLRLVDNRRGEL